MRTKIFLLSLILGLVSGEASFAENSSEYAAMGKAVSSAFECSALAGASNNLKEQERLFKYGYDQGLKFINAIQSGKVKKEDMVKSVPLLVVFRLEGPTPDFILGRIFESASSSALEDVYKSGELYITDEKMQETIAKDKFWKQNCPLIGK